MVDFVIFNGSCLQSIWEDFSAGRKITDLISDFPDALRIDLIARTSRFAFLGRYARFIRRGSSDWFWSQVHWQPWPGPVIRQQAVVGKPLSVGGRDVVAPFLHETAAPLKKVGAAVGSFYLTYRMRERGLCYFSGRFCLLAAPVAER